MTVNNGRFSDLGSRSFRVVDNCPELGTEGQAADWTWEEVVPRQNLYWDANRTSYPSRPLQVVATPQSKIEFSNDADCLAGKSSVLVRFWPVANQVRHHLSEIETGRHPAGGQDPAGLLEQAAQRRHPRLGGAPSGDHALRIARRSSPCSGRPSTRPPCRTASGKRGTTGCTAAFPCVPRPGGCGRREGELPATLNYLTIEFGPAGSRGVGAIVDRRHGDPLADGPE